MNDTVGTLAGGRYSNKDIVAAVILEIDIHVFVVIYGSFVIKEYKVNSRFLAYALLQPIPCGNQFLGFHFSNSLEVTTGFSFSTLKKEKRKKKASFRAIIAISSLSNHWGCYLFFLSTSL